MAPPFPRAVDCQCNDQPTQPFPTGADGRSVLILFGVHLAAGLREYPRRVPSSISFDGRKYPTLIRGFCINCCQHNSCSDSATLLKAGWCTQKITQDCGGTYPDKVQKKGPRWVRAVPCSRVRSLVPDTRDYCKKKMLGVIACT